MNTHPPVPEFACSWRSDAVTDARFPIVLSGNPPSYWLVLQNGPPESFAPLKHCPNCGGLLPRRQGALLEHDIEELREAKEICKAITTITEMFELLGRPDREANVRSFVRQYQYRSRWKTVAVTVSQCVDGTFGFAYSRRSGE
jgi:hypothetical protein